MSDSTTGPGRVLEMPLLALRDVVVFPHQPVSLIVGRSASVAAVQAAWDSTREIFLLAQRESALPDPDQEDLFSVGTVARLEQALRLPDGKFRILVEGKLRGRLLGLNASGGHQSARVQLLAVAQAPPEELVARGRLVREAFEKYAQANRSIPAELLSAVERIEDPGQLADVLIPSFPLKQGQRQELLEAVSPAARLDMILELLQTEMEFLSVEAKLRRRSKREKNTAEQEGWFAEQVKVLRKEGGDDVAQKELSDLAEQVEARSLPEEALTRSRQELRRLSQMNMMSAEAAVIRAWLEWILAMPWELGEGQRPTLADAARILHEDHHGLKEVKQRILELIAVEQLVQQPQGTVLCLVGPPGVGKTSLGRSIARATGRSFARIALGGVRDEAEIRGHRRTYIGAMPGKLIHAMKRAGTRNPVILLDEVDKMSSDFRGDPAAALLEVLDPEQNRTFVDHYLDVDYDLSQVSFIATANTLQGIPAPLLDRLEILEIHGYTEEEKLAIAGRYLLPRQREANGLSEHNLAMTRDAVVAVIRRYTKEAGVRELERQLARVARKVATHIVHTGHDVHLGLGPDGVTSVLGVPRYQIREAEPAPQVGLVKGLAVTPWGGEILDIEVAVVEGKGQVQLTGRLGDWLKESAAAGLTFLRSRAATWGLPEDFASTKDIHVHYPGNALRTDGPSAGAAMATALLSALTERPVRADLAMTGEISLRGRVLRIGGLREKLLAAHRAGLTTVLIPADNARDLEDVPAEVLAAVQILPVHTMDEVLALALLSEENEASEKNRAGGVDGSEVPGYIEST
ncbi:MAG: endopeptidase La [Deltaproteobacteria bacterium]|nr:endopeptidase La [Deltaproteobacteria bacterium]